MPHEQRLREEFTKWHSSETTFALGVPSDMSIADWWLQKIAELHKSWVEEKIQQIEAVSKGDTFHSKEFNSGYFQACMYTVQLLTLPSSTDHACDWTLHYSNNPAPIPGTKYDE